MTKFPWWRRTWHFAGQGSKRIEKMPTSWVCFYPSNDYTPMIVTNHSPTGFWQWSPFCQKAKVCVLGLLENVELRFLLSFTEISRARKPIRNHQTSDEDIPCILSLGRCKFQRNKYVDGSSNWYMWKSKIQVCLNKNKLRPTKETCGSQNWWFTARCVQARLDNQMILQSWLIFYWENEEEKKLDSATPT